MGNRTFVIQDGICFLENAGFLTFLSQLSYFLIYWYHRLITIPVQP